MSFIEDLSPVTRSGDDTAVYSGITKSLSRRNSSGNLDASGAETLTSRTRSGLSQIKQESTPVTQKEFANLQLQLRSIATRVADLERKNLKINPSVVDSTWQEILKLRAFVGYTENSPSRRTRSSYDDLQFVHRTPSPNSNTNRLTIQSNRFFPRGQTDAVAGGDEVYAALSPMLESDCQSPTGFDKRDQRESPPQIDSAEVRRLVAVEVAQQLACLRPETPHHIHIGTPKALPCPILTEKEDLQRHAVELDEVRERICIQQKLINASVNLHNRLQRGYLRHLDELHNPSSDASRQHRVGTTASRDPTPERLSRRRLQNREDLMSPPDNRRSMSPIDHSDEEDAREIARMRAGGIPPSSSTTGRANPSPHPSGGVRMARTTSNLSQTSGFHSPAVAERLMVKANALVDILCEDTALLTRISAASVERGAWNAAFNASLKPPDAGFSSQWQVESDRESSPLTPPTWLRLIQEKCREEADKAVAGAEKYLQEVACPSVISAAMKDAVGKLENELGERFQSRMTLLESAVDGHRHEMNILQTTLRDEVTSATQEAQRRVGQLVESARQQESLSPHKSKVRPQDSGDVLPSETKSNSFIDCLVSDTSGAFAPRSLTEFILLRPITPYEINKFMESSSNSTIGVVRKAISFLETLKVKGVNLLDFLNESSQGISDPLFAAPSTNQADLSPLLESLKGYLQDHRSLFTWQQHLNQIITSARKVDQSTTSGQGSVVDASVTAARVFYHAKDLLLSLGKWCAPTIGGPTAAGPPLGSQTTSQTTPPAPTQSPNPSSRLVFDVEYERMNNSGGNSVELQTSLSNLVKDMMKQTQQNRSVSEQTASSHNRLPAAARSEVKRTHSASRPHYPHLAPTVPLTDETAFRPHVPGPHAHVKGVFSPSTKPRMPHANQADLIQSPSARIPNEEIRASFTQPYPRQSERRLTEGNTSFEGRYGESKHHVVRSPSVQYAEIHSRSSSAPVHRPVTVVHHHYHPAESLEAGSEQHTPSRGDRGFYDSEDPPANVMLATVSPSASRTSGLYNFQPQPTAEELQRRAFMEKSRRATRNALAAARLYYK